MDSDEFVRFLLFCGCQQFPWLGRIAVGDTCLLRSCYRMAQSHVQIIQLRRSEERSKRAMMRTASKSSTKWLKWIGNFLTSRIIDDIFAKLLAHLSHPFGLLAHNGARRAIDERFGTDVVGEITFSCGSAAKLLWFMADVSVADWVGLLISAD